MAKAKRSKVRARVRTKKRTERVTFAFTAEDLDLLDRAAAHVLETRGKWAYRKLVFAARVELGLPTQPKKEPGS